MNKIRIRIEVTGSRGRRIKQLLDHVKETTDSVENTI